MRYLAEKITNQKIILTLIILPERGCEHNYARSLCSTNFGAASQIYTVNRWGSKRRVHFTRASNIQPAQSDAAVQIWHTENAKIQLKNPWDSKFHHDL